MVTKSSGMAMVTIQAPWVNFVIRTMTRTIAVKVAPMALIAWERRILARELLEAPLVSSRCQCRTMPSWERVKETKTPMMYSWMIELTLALKATIRAMQTASRMMPLL